jgi:hypothetical protein
MTEDTAPKEDAAMATGELKRRLLREYGTGAWSALNSVSFSYNENLNFVIGMKAILHAAGITEDEMAGAKNEWAQVMSARYAQPS